MNKQILSQLYVLANEADKAGLRKIADRLDKIADMASGTPPVAGNTTATPSKPLPPEVQKKYQEYVAKYKIVGVGSAIFRDPWLSRQAADSRAILDYGIKANLLKKQTSTLSDGKNKTTYSGSLVGVRTIEYMMSGKSIYAFAVQD